MMLSAPWKGKKAGVIRRTWKRGQHPPINYGVLVGWYDFCMHINLFNYNFDKPIEE